jgi:hypothetical protein
MKACNSWQRHGNVMSMEPHAGTCLARIADQHRRQVVDIAVDDAEKYGDGGLVGGDRIEIANAIALLQHQGWGDACPGGIRAQRARRDRTARNSE